MTCPVSAPSSMGYGGLRISRPGLQPHVKTKANGACILSLLTKEGWFAPLTLCRKQPKLVRSFAVNKTVIEREYHPIVGEAAPLIDVRCAEDGSAYALADLWQKGPAVVVFLRHFGCAFCQEHIAQLRRDLDRFQQYGANIGLLTVTPPANAKQFCEDRDLTTSFTCLCDPAKNAYHAYDLSRGTSYELLSPHVIARGLQATLHGHFNGRPKGDPFQMPGVFIVDQGGIVRYVHRHKDAADNPPNAELLAVLKELQ